MADCNWGWLPLKAQPSSLACALPVWTRWKSVLTLEAGELIRGKTFLGGNFRSRFIFCLDVDWLADGKVIPLGIFKKIHNISCKKTQKNWRLWLKTNLVHKMYTNIISNGYVRLKLSTLSNFQALVLIRSCTNAEMWTVPLGWMKRNIVCNKLTPRQFLN